MAVMHTWRVWPSTGTLTAKSWPSAPFLAEVVATCCPLTVTSTSTGRVGRSGSAARPVTSAVVAVLRPRVWIEPIGYRSVAADAEVARALEAMPTIVAMATQPPPSIRLPLSQ